ncbi:hypothetical protein B0H14DRAFT_2900269 [Mycena olivaceomarginata]|nr:hypothetical protein B0H14DRAFT_2900269 [Mycena olivaceomarginata]
MSSLKILVTKDRSEAKIRFTGQLSLPDILQTRLSGAIADILEDSEYWADTDFETDTGDENDKEDATEDADEHAGADVDVPMPAPQQKQQLPPLTNVQAIMNIVKSNLRWTNTVPAGQKIAEQSKGGGYFSLCGPCIEAQFFVKGNENPEPDTMPATVELQRILHQLHETQDPQNPTKYIDTSAGQILNWIGDGWPNLQLHRHGHSILEAGIVHGKIAKI